MHQPVAMAAAAVGAACSASSTGMRRGVAAAKCVHPRAAISARRKLATGLVAQAGAVSNFSMPPMRPMRQCARPHARRVAVVNASTGALDAVPEGKEPNSSSSSDFS